MYGHISFEEFCDQCCELLYQQNKLDVNQWRKVDLSKRYLPPDVQSGLYITLTSKCILQDNTRLSLVQDEVLDDLSCIDAQTPVVEDGFQNRDRFIKEEFHILYSQSYNVPVLYFTKSYADGRLVPLDTIWSSIPKSCVQNQTDLWSLISQDDHPYCGVPFYYLHPCHTAEMMGALLGNTDDNNDVKKNYLLLWLSAVAPVVGLPVSCSALVHGKK